jgi:hypothetical protein
MEALTKGIPQAIGKAADVIKALNDLIPLFASVAPPQVALTIKGVLNLVITFLQGFVREMQALLNAQEELSASLEKAAGNPTLSANLACAQANLEISQKNLMASLGPMQPLLGMLQTLKDFVQVDLGLPDLAAISQGSDAKQAIDEVTQAIDTIKQVLDTLPG